MRSPGNGGTVVDVDELVQARNGFKVGHKEDTYQQMIDHFAVSDNSAVFLPGHNRGNLSCLQSCV